MLATEKTKRRVFSHRYINQMHTDDMLDPKPICVHLPFHLWLKTLASVADLIA